MVIAHTLTTPESDNTNDSNITISSHVVSGTKPVLIVKIAARGATVTGSTVVWDTAGVNESLTLLNRDRNGNALAEIWYKANPTAKTADVTITLSEAANRKVAAASNYTDVDTTTPFRLAANNSSNGTDVTPTVDIIALNTEMVVDSMCQVSAGPDTINSQSSTNRHDAAATGGGTDTRGASGEIASLGATETMDYNMSSNDNWAICGGALQITAAAGAARRYFIVN